MFSVLGLLMDGRHLSQADIAAHLNVSKSTVTRVLKEARTVYGVRIERIGGKRWGNYQIEDWGTLDQNAIKRVTALYKARP